MSIYFKCPGNWTFVFLIEIFYILMYNIYNKVGNIMSYFETFKYNDNLYQLKDALGVLVTLVIGEDKALLFDTGYGIGNLKEEINTITNKPLIVINSHGHMDHSCGNYQFEKVYINKTDLPLCIKHNSKPWRIRNIESAKNLKVLPNDFNEDLYINQTEGNLDFININDIIDLGNLKIKVVDMRGHTKGSIGLLIEQWKTLLVSDATCPFVWLFLEESTSVSEYVKMLEKVLKYDFNNFLVGHGAKLFPKQKMIDFYEVAKNIDLEKSVKVSFNNFDNLNSYCYTLGKMYDQNDCGIVFDPNKM